MVKMSNTQKNLTRLRISVNNEWRKRYVEPIYGSSIGGYIDKCITD